MTKQIERLVRRFNAAQKQLNVMRGLPGYAPMIDGFARDQAALALSVAVSKHVAAQARPKKEARDAR